MKPDRTLVQILAFNDFHGNLEPPIGSSGSIDRKTAGGIEYLATHIEQLRAHNKNTLVVSAGDLIGASPLVSALFHDEPTIEAMNLLGLDLNAVGNHEFDDGLAELLRMQYGGCHPTDGCLEGRSFTGAQFQFLAANVFYQGTPQSIFPAYQIREFDGVKIGFIGLTLEGTPEIVRPLSVENLSFSDEAETINALVPILKQAGANAIVVLLHEGGYPTGSYNECPGISGAIVEIVNHLDKAVDAVISGHTHQAYNCLINHKVVTSAASYGRLVTQMQMEFDPTSGRLESVSANNHIVSQDVAKQRDESALIDHYKRISQPIANRIVGLITQTFNRSLSDSGESELGHLLADAQLEASTLRDSQPAEIALMNPGGIRADLLYKAASTKGHVTYGDIFSIQPFGNNMVTLLLSGEEITQLLEEQFAGCEQQNDRILHVSQGFSYTFSKSAPPCHKILANSLTLNGALLKKDFLYRVTANSFLAEGGDGFPIFKKGRERTGGVLDIEAFEAYLKAHTPLSPKSQKRIKVVP